MMPDRATPEVLRYSEATYLKAQRAAAIASVSTECAPLIDERRQPDSTSSQSSRKRTDGRQKSTYNVGLVSSSYSGFESDNFWEAFHRGYWTIIPEAAESRSDDDNRFHWTHYFDILIGILLICTAFLVPMELAVMPVDDTSMWKQVAFCVFDVCFLIDVVLHFFTAYPINDHHTSTASWEVNPSQIAKRYCAFPFTDQGQAGWFWIDMIAVLIPSCTSLTMIALGHREFRSRGLRALRMLRLGRLLQLKVKLKSAFRLSYYTLKFLTFLGVTSLACHWFACGWIMIEGSHSTGFLSYKTDENTWLTVLIGDGGKGDPCHPDAHQDPLCMYLVSIYWASMTLTTVGYGDIIPQNVFEYNMCTLFMLVAGYIWAFIMGELVSLLMNFDPYGDLFKAQMDDLNQMMAARELPHTLRVRVRRYMLEARDSTRLQGQNSLLRETMSQGLQREVARRSATFHFLKEIYWAKDLEEDARLDLVKAMVDHFFGPKEAIAIQGMVVVLKGLMAAKGRILGRGDFWGQDNILLESMHLMDKAQPFTISYVSVSSLTRGSLREVCLNYPLTEQRIRRAQVRTAVYRSFITLAEHKRKENAKLKSSETLSKRLELPPPTLETGVEARVGKIEWQLQRLRSKVDNLTHRMQDMSDSMKTVVTLAVSQVSAHNPTEISREDLSGQSLEASTAITEGADT